MRLHPADKWAASVLPRRSFATIFVSLNRVGHTGLHWTLDFFENFLRIAVGIFRFCTGTCTCMPKKQLLVSLLSSSRLYNVQGNMHLSRF